MEIGGRWRRRLMFTEHQLYPECFTHCQWSISNRSVHDSTGWQFELHSASQVSFCSVSASAACWACSCIISQLPGPLEAGRCQRRHLGSSRHGPSPSNRLAQACTNSGKSSKPHYTGTFKVSSMSPCPMDQIKSHGQTRSTNTIRVQT